MNKTKQKWMPTGRGNELLEGESFFISWNPMPSIGPDTMNGETALVKRYKKGRGLRVSLRSLVGCQLIAVLLPLINNIY